mmetsp:Transcript_16419/g.27507  ORF Transcript_16419/g.27507 Transcript_16419/m.27507 type:complete len:295 (-) Transcript_16419:859-1743(-)
MDVLNRLYDCFLRVVYFRVHRQYIQHTDVGHCSFSETIILQFKCLHLTLKLANLIFCRRCADHRYGSRAFVLTTATMATLLRARFLACSSTSSTSTRGCCSWWFASGFSRRGVGGWEAGFVVCCRLLCTPQTPLSRLSLPINVIVFRITTAPRNATGTRIRSRSRSRTRPTMARTAAAGVTIAAATCTVRSVVIRMRFRQRRSSLPALPSASKLGPRPRRLHLRDLRTRPTVGVGARLHGEGPVLVVVVGPASLPVSSSLIHAILCRRRCLGTLRFHHFSNKLNPSGRLFRGRR